MMWIISRACLPNKSILVHLTYMPTGYSVFSISPTKPLVQQSTIFFRFQKQYTKNCYADLNPCWQSEKVLARIAQHSVHAVGRVQRQKRQSSSAVIDFDMKCAKRGKSVVLDARLACGAV